MQGRQKEVDEGVGSEDLPVGRLPEKDHWKSDGIFKTLSTSRYETNISH